MGQILTFKAPDVVAFDHRFFSSFPDAHFRLDESEGVPVYAFGLGAQKVALTFAGIKREFAMREYGHDAVMLNTVERSLQFVSLLGIGDPIPPEILTGDASWEPSKLHGDAALKRIGAYLTAWQMERPVALSDPIRLERFIAAHVNDIAVGKALARLATQLGSDVDNETVSGTMDAAVEEISYIEALRERYLAVCQVGSRLKKVRRDFAHHASVVGDVDPVSRLISIPIHALGLKLAEVDARLSGVVSLFGNFDFHRRAIRDIRDEMFAHLNPWEEITEAWARLPVNISDPYAVAPLLRDLYKYLAPRFMPADTWALLLANDARLDENRQYGRVTTWFERGDAAV
ncbi:MAG: hypothetical protein ABJ215_06870 [Alphaproteobacteria bacterium]